MKTYDVYTVEGYCYGSNLPFNEAVMTAKFVPVIRGEEALNVDKFVQIIGTDKSFYGTCAIANGKHVLLLKRA
jgi:hypothetical protein